MDHMNQKFDAAFVGRCRTASIRISSVIALTITLGLVGCGGGDFKPQLGLVSGTVTINGTPAPDVLVTFEPQGSGGKGSLVGSASTAKTDAQGKFELKYGSTDEKGAVVGKHVVRIESAAGGGPAGGANAVALVLIPENYNTTSTLTANVATGNNPPVNFDLQIPK